MAADQSNVENHQHKKVKTTSKNRIPSAVWFMIIALAASLGFVAGAYKYQIMAAVGPVFGQKAHSASLDLTSLQQTYNELASNYDGKLDDTLLIQGANRGLVAAAGDKYTTYMSPQEATDFEKSLSGDVGSGIGAVIGLKNDQVIIASILADNPAQKAGLSAGDIILSVNDQSTTGWTVDKTVSVIRGEAGTTVKLSIKRDNQNKDFTVTRAVINNPSVTSSIFDGIGILTITRFDDKTGGLARVAAQGFKNQAVKGIILDLRSNGGGVVTAAVDVVSLWLDNKVVLTERTGDIVKDELRSGSNTILAGIPTVVLVNGGTASASEIVAGALQDSKAAKLVGEKTFGKGSVQQPINLSGGALLKVTIARWYTPNGKNINQDGIMPDVEAVLTQANIDNGIDPQINAAKKILGM